MKTEEQIRSKLRMVNGERTLINHNKGKRGNKSYMLPFLAQQAETLRWVLGEVAE